MAAPKGNQNAAKSKDWEHTLRRVLKTFELKDKEGNVTVERGQALRQIAEQCVLQAIAGDKDARQEIANRLDGKPTEHVHVDGTVEHITTYGEYLNKARPAVPARDPEASVQ